MDKDFLTKAIRKTAEEKEKREYDKIKSDFLDSYISSIEIDIGGKKVTLSCIIQDYHKNNDDYVSNISDIREARRVEIEKRDTVDLIEKLGNVSTILGNMDRGY